MSILDSELPNAKVSKKKGYRWFSRNTSIIENKRRGVNPRSRNGCDSCKRKKKKCDERRPRCERCVRANLTCTWRGPELAEERQCEKFTTRDIRPSNDNPETQHLQTQIEKFDKDTRFKDISASTSEETDSLLEFLCLSPPGLNQDNSDGAIELETSHFVDKYNRDEFHHFDTEIEKESRVELLKASVCSRQHKSDEACFLLTSLKESFVSESMCHSLFFDFKLNKHPSSKLLTNLQKEEITYLNYYINFVSQTVSILPKQSNFFLSLYLPLAENHKFIVYGLIGWACVFSHNVRDQHKSLFYVEKAMRTFDQELKFRQLTIIDKVATASLYFILSAALICSGDVENWYKYFRDLHHFLLTESHGVFKKIRKFFGSSIETRWLISNFLYHDVLASASHSSGTCFTMAEYCEVLDVSISSCGEHLQYLEEEDSVRASDCLENDLTCEEFSVKATDRKPIVEIIDNEFVCDPLQGCVRPIYILIGEIINASVKLKNCEKVCNSNELQGLKDKVYSQRGAKYKQLKMQLENTKPQIKSLCFLKCDKDLELHLTLFEVYKISTSIYLESLIKNVPPFSPKIQNLLLKLLPCIDIVIDSTVQTSLGFPLLIAGISCTSERDRSFIEDKLQRMSDFFPVKTFPRILAIIRHSWRINKDGLDCIYWFEISKEFGWDLCLA